jgi:transposase
MIEVGKSQTEDIVMQIKSIGIDLGKTTFHLVALGMRSQVVVRKKFSRQQLLWYTANLPSSLIGLEACVGAHFLGRALREQGHEVRLMPAQFVRPFVKSNKNDYRDAEAIAEAVERENMRFVPIKTEDQLDVQALHRVRERLVSRRTSVINQIRAFLLERGISFAKGPASLRRLMPEILENADDKLTARMRRLLDFLWQEWKHLQLQIESLGEDLEKIASSDEACISLAKNPRSGSTRGHGCRICHRQRRRLQKGAGVFRLAGARTRAMVDRREDETIGNQ